jgi:hypothetical protein
MSWGCEHGDGWYDILDELCKNLSHPFFYGPFKRYTSVPRNSLCEWLFMKLPWWDILDKILLKKVRIADEDKGVVFAQIKEKFGTLRIYTNGIASEVYKEVSEFIDAAERKSATTCELCGGPAKLKTTGWYITICDKCENDVRISKNEW